MNKKKRKKLRVPFRKKHERRGRQKKIDAELVDEDQLAEEAPVAERMTGKGDLSRYRTVLVEEGEDGLPLLDVDEEQCLKGRVVAAVGLNCLVQGEDGQRYECTVRRVLRMLAADARNTVVTGDTVLFRPLEKGQGVIERVEPRTAVLSRRWQHQEHIIVANVDQVVIVASAADPPLKTTLIDRFLISAEKGDVQPLICINKTDLVSPAELQPVVGLYARLGYETILTSAAAGQNTPHDHPGIQRLRRLLSGHQTVFAGQSGVGKSSLLNILQPDWQLRTGEVSAWSRKGRHTTRRAILLELDSGGWVVDTPGIRQFSLWDVLPEEVEGYFVEMRPFVPWCHFPDCSHTHEEGCGVKRAVAAELIAPLRYESYLRLRSGDED